MGNKEDLRVKRTRKLLSQALRALLQEKNFNKISIKDICDKALVHRTTFYKHFSDKYDLFIYAFDEVRDEIYTRSITSSNYNNIKELYLNIARITFDYIKENSNMLKNLIKHKDNEFLKGIFYESIERSIQYLLEKNSKNFEIPTKVISQFYTGGFVSLSIWWIDNMDKYSEEQMLTFIKKLVSFKDN